jgi:hypothetical protein
MHETDFKQVPVQIYFSLLMKTQQKFGNLFNHQGKEN